MQEGILTTIGQIADSVRQQHASIHLLHVSIHYTKVQILKGPLVKMHRSLQCYNSWYPLYTCHYINGLCSFLKDCILIYEGQCWSMYFYFCCSFGTILALTRRSFICCTVPFKPYKVCIYTKQPTLDEEKSVRYFKRTGVQS